MICKRNGVLLLYLMFILLAVSANAWAETAVEITEECIITSPGKQTGNAHDKKYTSYWNSRQQKNPYLEFVTPDDTPAYWLYICFGEMPADWCIEIEENQTWHPYLDGENEYYHTVLALNGIKHFRIIDTSGKRVQFKINDVFVFGEGELPDWVQQWQPTKKKADIMVIAAHPDDELLFFGGTIPVYDVEMNKDVVVVYMSYSNTTRRSELLNGLWSMGIRNYPVIGDFHDTYSSKLEDAYNRWRKDKVFEFIYGVLRRYKPEVVLTHDINGEYGHGAHKLCADAVRECVLHVAERGYDPESLKQWGAWQVKKLYLHLYPENQIVMNWSIPLNSFDGKTGLELAAEAYGYHITQQRTDFKVSDTGEMSCACFGLVYTLVGPDEKKNDFLEHITGEPFIGVERIPEKNGTESDIESGSYELRSAPYGKAKADVEWPIAKPCLDAYGYPLEGETVVSDAENGVWFYASPSLIVRIDRVFQQDKPVTWYEAHIFCDLDREHFGSILYDDEHPQKKHVQPALIARSKQIVFGMNTDYYTYRLGRKTMIGMIIRNRRVFFDRVPEANRRQFPNLDTLSMYEDGEWRVYRSDELTSQQYLDSGAVDVFAFGPYLVRNGEPSDFVPKMKNGKTEQPRCAIGMIEPGHYYAVLAEGRMQKISVGVNIDWLLEHMLNAGCKEALNLDGGQTAVMCFMGEQITRIGRYAGGRTTPRDTTELMGIGRSDLIDVNLKK